MAEPNQHDVSAPEGRTVVVGYDGSRAARDAVEHAVQLAGAGRVVIVHAHDPAAPHQTARWRELLDEGAQGRADAILDALAREDHTELGGRAPEVRVETGHPAEAILRVADEVAADAIVVGSHGYGPVSSLLGSVSQAVLHGSGRPVTVIPPAEGRDAGGD